MKAFGAPPLFLQTLGLAIITLIAAQTAAMIVLFALPPPAPEIHTVGDVVHAIGLANAPAHGDRVLTVRPTSQPPAMDTQGLHRRMFRDALARELGISPENIVVAQHGTRFVAFGGPRRAPRPLFEAAGPEPIIFGGFRIGIRQPDGRWLEIEPRHRFGLDPWQERLLLVFALGALAVAPIAWAFSRRLAAPITALAAGAERLGRDPGSPPLQISGSAEVGVAVAAFNQMQERIRRYVEDRTSMVGAIAHDLRTPLTRLRFRLEGVPDSLRAKMEADLDQMEAMITSTMGFVRDASRQGERQRLELASLVETVMDEAALTGADASVIEADRVVVEGDALALKRLITNLVDNALKYGVRARARVSRDDGAAIIEIDDDGPGMPESDIERVFEPFQRLETSRNRETGGIGLGLAVVRAVARSHGGDVILVNRSGGGLSARVTLPLTRGLDAAGARV